MKCTVRLSLAFSLFCGFPAASHLLAQPQSVVDTVTGAYDPSELSELTGISGFSGMDQVVSEPADESIMPETNGVTVHHVAQTDNFKKVMNYFSPYLGVLAFSFAATLIHEMGHNVVNLAVNKQWSKIWIGEWGTPEKINQDSVLDNKWLSIYLPNELMYFRGATISNIKNKNLEAICSLMGPCLGALSSWFILQLVHNDPLKYVARHQLFKNVVPNVLTKGTGSDGYLALQALNLPTQWMESFENNEYPLIQSAFNLVNIAHVVDIMMFSKMFQARNESQRIIMLVGQSAFRVLVPLSLQCFKNALSAWGDIQNKILGLWSKVSIPEMGTADLVIAPLLTVVIFAVPIIAIYGIILLNADRPFGHYLTKFF